MESTSYLANSSKLSYAISFTVVRKDKHFVSFMGIEIEI